MCARGHDGGLPGYRYFPDLGLGYVMLINATHSPRAYVEVRALLFAYLPAGIGRAGGGRPLAAARVPPGPSAAACACFGMTLYLLWHGIIGLRVWAW